MSINTFQFLSKDLTHSALIKMFYITKNNFFKQIDKTKIGYDTFNLKQVLLNRENTFKISNLNITIDGDILYLTNNKDDIYFYINNSSSSIELIAIKAIVDNINTFKKMIELFKEICDNFHLDECSISHSISLILVLKIKDNNYIEIPPYIKCTLLDDKRIITPCELI